MELVCTENAHSEPLVYSRTVASTALPAGRSTCIFQGQETLRFDGACLEFPSRWDLNSVSETAKELLNTCQTNAKYHMPNTKCQIANTLTNAKYEIPNNCQMVYPLAECQLKYMDKAMKHHNTMDQMVMKGDSTISEHFVSAFIDEKFGYQSETKVPLSSNIDSLQIVNTNEVTVRKSRATTVSHPHFRMKRDREPSRIPYRMVTRLNRKQLKNAIKLYIKKCVPKSSTLRSMLYGYHRHHFFERYTSSNFMISSKRCYTRQSLFILQTRTSKHKKVPLFCINAKGSNFRKLKQLLSLIKKNYIIEWRCGVKSWAF